MKPKDWLPWQGTWTEQDETEVAVRFTRTGSYVGSKLPLTVQLKVNGDLLENWEFAATPGDDFVGLQSQAITIPEHGKFVDRIVRVVNDKTPEPARDLLPYDTQLTLAPPETLAFTVEGEADEFVAWQNAKKINIYDGTRFYYHHWENVKDPLTPGDHVHVSVDLDDQGKAVGQVAFIANSYWERLPSGLDRSDSYGASADVTGETLPLSAAKTAGWGVGFDLDLTNLYKGVGLPIGGSYDYHTATTVQDADVIRTVENGASPATIDTIYEVRAYAERLQFITARRPSVSGTWAVDEVVEAGYTGEITAADVNRSRRSWLDPDNNAIVNGFATDENGNPLAISGFIAFSRNGSPLTNAPMNLFSYDYIDSKLDWREGLEDE